MRALEKRSPRALSWRLLSKLHKKTKTRSLRTSAARVRRTACILSCLIDSKSPQVSEHNARQLHRLTLAHSLSHILLCAASLAHAPAKPPAQPSSRDSTTQMAAAAPASRPQAYPYRCVCEAWVERGSYLPLRACACRSILPPYKAKICGKRLSCCWLWLAGHQQWKGAAAAA